MPNPTTTTLFPPPLRAAILGIATRLSDAYQKWFLTLQNLHPLSEVDTSTGPQTLTLPAAGLNSTTGQSNQNQEIIYVKTTADGNALQINGALGGPYSVNTQYATLRFKSNGTSWYKC